MKIIRMDKEKLRKEIKEKVSVTVQNIVAKIDIGQKIPLKDVAKYFRDFQVKFNPSKFPGLIIKMRDSISVLLFSSGKMVCTGAKTEKDIDDVINIIIDKLKEAGITLKSKPIVSIENVVATVNLGIDLALEKLIYELPNAIYEPELFPGIIYRIEHPEDPGREFVYLLFRTGRCVCTAAKNEEELRKAVDLLIDSLVEVIAE